MAYLCGILSKMSELNTTIQRKHMSVLVSHDELVAFDWSFSSGKQMKRSENFCLFQPSATYSALGTTHYKAVQK